MAHTYTYDAACYLATAMLTTRRCHGSTGVILLDSINLNPAAGKVTPRDEAMVEQLCRHVTVNKTCEHCTLTCSLSVFARALTCLFCHSMPEFTFEQRTVRGAERDQVGSRVLAVAVSDELPAT